MSSRSAALSVFFLLLLQSMDSTLARPLSSLPEFDLPEVDGSAVEDTCGVFFITTPDATETTTAATTTTTTKTTTTTPTPKKAATIKKPAVQSPPRKPETKNSEITDRLLYYLLANSRGLGAGLDRFRGRGHSSSESNESASALLKRAGRTKDKRQKIGSFSSEDSSDES